MPEPSNPSPESESKVAQAVLNQRLDYRGANGFLAFCRLRTFATALGIVAVVTEEAENTGMSVTNAAESVVSAATKLMGCDPETVMWIEHYNRGSYSRAQSPKRDEPQFSRIRIINGHARWEQMPAQLVEDLLGQTLD